MIKNGEDKKLPHIQRVFLYLTLEHSENREDQKLCLGKMKELQEETNGSLKETYAKFVKYALQHKEIIDRFGRFPHRNEVLGRQPTKEETEFLKQPGYSF